MRSSSRLLFSRLFLGIETSFDDTAVAVVRRHAAQAGAEVLANVRKTQLSASHGTIPHVAGDLHRAALPAVLTDALAAAGRLSPESLGGVACTVGPGLAPCLSAGLDFARQFALAHQLPFYPVHHMEGHLLTARMAAAVEFPFLVLLASGGHCLLVYAERVGVYWRLGTTLDDSPGEAFDKVARAFGLQGGAALEQAAAAGDPSRVAFATPLQRIRSCDFSFAGLKTAVFRHVYGGQYHGGTMKAGLADPRWLQPSASDAAFRADVLAAFQYTACHHIAVRVARALLYTRTSAKFRPPTALVASGGVVCNGVLRQELDALGARHNIPVVCPPAELCTDNAAMIAWVALEHELAYGLAAATVPAAQLPTLRFHPKWPLGDDCSADVLARQIEVPNSTRRFELHLRRHAATAI